jgi:TfoX/Sxy family transcriptional regulator of competence genes
MASPEAQVLAARVEAVVGPGLLTSKRMFGGFTFLLDGNMLCCASRKGLMVRVGAAAEKHALESPHASPCMGAGRPMPGFIMIDPDGIANDSDLARWIEIARSYVGALPAKNATKPFRRQSSSTDKRSNRNRKANARS